MEGKDLVSMADLNSGDIEGLIARAIEFKRKGSGPVLSGLNLALIFEKPSLRTRVSFEIAMSQLGGHALYLSQAEVGPGEREPIEDVARVLSRYVDGIVARTFSQRRVVLLARYASIPVINGLSDSEHPCQAVGDLLTIYEIKGKLKGLNLAFVGDGNNVANSLMLGASLMGMNFRVASPAGYEPPEEVLQVARRLAKESGAQLLRTSEPAAAVSDADIVYTDVWTSMGQETEREQRRVAFAGYQVDKQLLSLAKRDAVFMHPLPAHRGEEIASDIIDSPQSVVFLQAENRLHIQKAILVRLLKKD